MKPLRLRVLLSTLLVFGYLGSVSCFDYCTVPCRTRTQNNKHTNCLYPKLTTGPLCRNFDSGKELKEGDKELLLDLHNQLRRKVAEGKETRGSPGPQQPAANMMELVWDNELELIAKTWALQCDYKHDKCRQTKSQEYAGQNLGITFDSRGFRNDLEKIVYSWYDEVEQAPYRIAQSFSSSAGSGTIGHYTQLVWGETTRIGCARVFFYFSDWGMTEYLVCNYGTGGNVGSAPMYKVGKPCSSCGDGLKCSLKYPGLCGRAVEGTLDRADESDASAEEESVVDEEEAEVSTSTEKQVTSKNAPKKEESADGVKKYEKTKANDQVDLDTQTTGMTQAPKSNVTEDSRSVQGAAGIRGMVIYSILATLVVKFF